MILPEFTFNAEANAFLSETFTIDEQAIVHVELASRAPVVLLKQETDGGFANFGQTPKSGDHFNINITCNKAGTFLLAAPVEVTKCYILN